MNVAIVSRDKKVNRETRSGFYVRPLRNTNDVRLANFSSWDLESKTMFALLAVGYVIVSYTAMLYYFRNVYEVSLDADLTFAALVFIVSPFSFPVVILLLSVEWFINRMHKLGQLITGKDFDQ